MHKKRKTKHHRWPVSLGRDDSKENISMVSDKAHACFHYLFQNFTPGQIADELNRNWISREYRMVAINRSVGMTVSQVLSFKTA